MATRDPRTPSGATPRADTIDPRHPEVRAGPGDAGRQDRPERLPEPPGQRRRGRQATALLIFLLVIGLVVAAAVWLPVWFRA